MNFELFKFLVIDEFLPETFTSDLLDYAISQQSAFTPSEVETSDAGKVAMDRRRSLRCANGIGPHDAKFREFIHSRFDLFCEELGIAPFPPSKTEIELVANRDGDFFAPHIDTSTGNSFLNKNTTRLISCVFYLHKNPKSFNGGEIVLHPLFINNTEPTIIEPKHNRIVAFPSLAPHEVHTVSCPTNKFADSRFSINCWMHRSSDTSQPPR